MFSPIPILLYHRVDHRSGSFATTPAVLGQHLAWLAERGYRTLTASELGEVVSGLRAPPSEPCVAITFDDGYADLATEVAPLLRRHGQRATAFLITDRCPDQAQLDHAQFEPGYLAWPDARNLATEGVLEFQSHTHSHRRWDLGPALTTTVMDDLATARAELSRQLGEPEAAFGHVAWPWGRTCLPWEAAATHLGVSTQYVVQRGAVTHPGRHHRLPRLLVHGAPLTVLARWMAVLRNPVGARATNQLFGAVRQQRHGSGYR
jgi:peptidoglycan/xylan/chitin deacetylase (PgdA/CDA1 family)